MSATNDLRRIIAKLRMHGSLAVDLLEKQQSQLAEKDETIARLRSALLVARSYVYDAKGAAHMMDPAFTGELDAEGIPRMHPPLHHPIDDELARIDAALAAQHAADRSDSECNHEWGPMPVGNGQRCGNCGDMRDGDIDA